MRWYSHAGTLVLLLLLTACEDPSTVGLGIVGGEGGEPQLSDVPFTEFTVLEDEGIRDNSSRVLAGQVEDPVLGAVRAEGYLDFRNNVTLPPNYVSGTVETVLLQLQPEYLYGDTLTPVTFGLHEVMTEFAGRASTLDSIPEVGPELLQFTFMPTDSLVLATLPSDWVASKDSIFQVLDFDNLFHGFQLNPISGNAVVGFSNLITSQTMLRSVVDTDTVSFAGTRSITQYLRSGTPDLGDSFIPVQNGAGPKLRVQFDLDQFAGRSLNRIALQIQVDTTFYSQTPNFVRPEVRDLSMVGIANEGEQEILLGIGLIIDGSIIFDSANFRAIMQTVLLGADNFEHFEIRFPVSTTTGNTMDSALFYGFADEARQPRLLVTTTLLD